MQGTDHRGADTQQARLLLLTLTIVMMVCLGGLGSAVPALTSINATPNPALSFDSITVGSDGVDVASLGIAYNGIGDSYIVGMASGTWQCGSFVTQASGAMNSLTTIHKSGTSGFASKLRIFDYVNNNETGDLLASQELKSGTGSYYAYWYDFGNVTVTDGARYWACWYINHFSAYPRVNSGIADGNYLRYNAAEPVENSLIGGTANANDIMPIKAFIDVYTDVQLFVKLTSGDYTSDYVAVGDLTEQNPTVVFNNPCSISCILQAKAFSVNGWSSEVQTTLYVEDLASTQTHKTGIYLTAADWDTGSVLGDQATDYSGFLHNWRGFAAGSNGSYLGRVLIDGSITTTCNYEWDCLTALDVGTHTYSTFSTIGGYQYTGNFTIDANTNFVKLYVPLTYNLLKVWENSTEQSSVTCSDLYSLTAGGEVGTNQRIGVGLKVDSAYLNWNSGQVVPQNCYSAENLPAQYPYALPGQDEQTEPLVFAYSGSLGISDGELYGLHTLNDIVGTRNRNGYLNFYDLHAISEYYSTSGTFSGTVERKLATEADGFYSPLTSVVAPNMNVDSALFGDANYNPGDFALNDSITCEAAILSGGFVVYDVNVMLIVDQNAIYDQYSFTPFQKYNSSMNENQSNGAFNLVWHTFANVNAGHTGKVQCVFEVSNELGYRSGWVYSAPRMMYSSNYSSVGGMNVFVKDEDGTTSYMGHESAQSADLNNIDIYNWYHEPFYWTYNTSENPLSLFEGDGVIAQTWDRNASRAASKSFNINRGDSFDIDLYLADLDAHDQAPVTSATQMYEQSAYGDRVYCTTDFYDKDLDWNGTKFSFWTGKEGSLSNPLCTKTVNYAYTTNCNPIDSPCLTPGATTVLMSECGSDNDCSTETYFSKRGCTSMSSGEVTGYCAMQVYDLNGNVAMAQASTFLTVPQYQVFALCDAYGLDGATKENVVYTSNEKGYVECIIGLDNVSEPSDLNWSVVFEDKSLIWQETLHDDYTDQDTFRFRVDATEELDALARIKSTDGETWEGDSTVFVLHPIYGAYDAPVHITVTFLGSREGRGEAGEYSEENFNELYYWIDGFIKDAMTDPMGMVQTRFYEVLVITLFIIIFAPLFIVAGLLAAKKKSEGE